MWNLMASRAAAMLVVLCTAVPAQVVGATHGAKAKISDCLINLAAARRVGCSSPHHLAKA